VRLGELNIYSLSLYVKDYNHYVFIIHNCYSKLIDNEQTRIVKY